MGPRIGKYRQRQGHREGVWGLHSREKVYSENGCAGRVGALGSSTARYVVATSEDMQREGRVTEGKGGILFTQLK